MKTKIITSILDDDLYKLTMQWAVMRLYPEVEAEYRFILRSDVTFTEKMMEEVRQQVDHLGTLSMRPDEYYFLAFKCPYLPRVYRDFLKGFNYDPSEVKMSLDAKGRPDIRMRGPWYRTIKWEVVLMAIISETYFMHVDKKWDYTDQEDQFTDKSTFFEDNSITFADFGTRRRRSLRSQSMAVRAFRGNPNFVGTSNVHLARLFDTNPIGTMAHEWIMAHSTLTGMRHANKYALESWVDVYGASLGIALTDTYGTDAFFDDFDLKLAMLYSGVRHDSGPAREFADKVIGHYERLGIDPKTKTIVFSDGLSPLVARNIEDYVNKRIKTSYGIGTNFTNDFEGSPALNMVIKLWAVDGVPVVKLSDDLGKACGQEGAINAAKWMFGIA